MTRIADMTSPEITDAAGPTDEDFRAIGFTKEASNWPRDELAVKMIAAFNGVPADDLPSLAWRYFPNKQTADAWKRVADVALAAGRAEAVAAPAAEADWKKAFAAQSRKLQAVLHIPGVKETLAELTWYDGHDPSASQEALRDALASHIATVIDDIEVTKDGFCKWSDVANARDAIYRTVRSAALAQSAPVKGGE